MPMIALNRHETSVDGNAAADLKLFVLSIPDAERTPCSIGS